MKQEIRLVLTQACNYNCCFCHHEGVNNRKENILNKDDVVYLYKVFYHYYKVDSMTITGGEPLLVNNIQEIVKELYKNGCSTTIVTNGSLLDKRVDVCKYIKKLNISLHSLEKNEYESIVRTNGTYEKVINNIKKIREKYPNLEINLNYAVTKSGEIKMKSKIKAIIDFAKRINVNIKFIEIFPKGDKMFYPMEKLEKILITNGYSLVDKCERKNTFLNNNSKVYTTKCLCAKAIEHNKPDIFCNQNNDLFIAQDGTIKPCRIQNYEISILDAIKERNEQKVIEILREALRMLGKKCPYSDFK